MPTFLFQTLLQIGNPILHPNIQAFSSTNNPVGYFNYLLPKLITIGFVIAILYFVFLFITGAIAWITSGADKVALENARRRITQAIIGLIILLLIYFIGQLMNRIFGLNIGQLRFPNSPPFATSTPPVPSLPPASSTCSDVLGTCSCSCSIGYVPGPGSCGGGYPACLGTGCSCVDYYSVYPSQQQIYYQFSEGNGTSIGDSSGNSNVGTITDPGDTWSMTGCGGHSIHSNGTPPTIQGSSGTAASAFVSAPSFTYSVWINRDRWNPSGAFNLIFDTRRLMGFGFLGSRPNNLMYWVGWDNTNDGCYSGGAYNTNTLFSNDTISDGVWYHVAVTYDATSQTATLYINGAANGSTSGIPSPEAYCSSPSPIAIGGGSGVGVFGFQGYLDEVNVYNYALSPTQISSLYSSCTPI